MKVAHGLKAELGPVVLALSRDRCEYQPEMVTRFDAVDDFPANHLGQSVRHDRIAVRPGVPPAAGKLVDIVAGRLAEEPGQCHVPAPRAWTTTNRAVAATSNVRFRFEMPTYQRGGCMLHWVAKPTRHPARPRSLDSGEDEHRTIQMRDETPVGSFIFTR